ncbi:hypothetical protein INR49_008545 [Caranx melampygus]|nr:hypothetical protein INR49_008545 [Caranx melampygus]
MFISGEEQTRHRDTTERGHKRKSFKRVRKEEQGERTQKKRGWLGAPLQQTAWPGDNGQGDSAPQLLQKAHQCCVGHSPGTLPIHLQQDVPTPAQREKEQVVHGPPEHGYMQKRSWSRSFCLLLCRKTHLQDLEYDGRGGVFQVGHGLAPCHPRQVHPVYI